MPDFLRQLLEILRDLPTFLDGFVADHGIWVYALLFAIIFAETGLVILPFLPGDSLLFAAGAVAARGHMNPWLLALVLIVAAVLGDAVNYHLGRWIGPKVFSRGAGERAARASESSVAATASDTSAASTAVSLPPARAASTFQRLLEKALNRKHLDRAHAFFDQYGGKAVVLARFVPIVRTFIPFVAGAGAMNYSKFAIYNVVGAVLWVGICVGAGWYFGNFEWVKHNFEAVLVAIIVVSLIPLAVEFILSRRKGHSKPVATEGTPAP